MKREGQKKDTVSKVKKDVSHWKRCATKIDLCHWLLFNLRPSVCFNVFFYFLFFFQILKVMQSGKTASWIQGRSKVRPTVSEQNQGSISGERKSLRRSLGLETFPNVQLFRTFMPFAGKHNVKQVLMDENF